MDDYHRKIRYLCGGQVQQLSIEVWSQILQIADYRGAMAGKQ